MNQQTTEQLIAEYRFFIEAWQSAKSLQEVVKKTGLTVKQVNTRVGWLRKKGVPLKSFGRRKITKDEWEKLQAFARNCADGEANKRFRTVG